MNDDERCPTGAAPCQTSGARFRHEGITTGLFGCEHMAHSFGQFEGAIRADNEAMGYSTAWAIHGYGDGIKTDTAVYQQSVPTDLPF